MLSLVFNFCYYAVFVTVPIIIFVLFSKDDNFHSTGGLLYFIKFLFGRRAIGKYQNKLKNSKKFLDHSIEEAKCIENESQSDTLSFAASDQNGNQLCVNFTLRANHIAEISICLRINESIYILPNKNDANIKEHEIWTRSIPKYQWKCQGLNIEVLEPMKRCRVTFNGFLMDVCPAKYGNVEHIKFNFIWNCCSKPNISWLDDDLNLLTRSLAKTTWRNGNWLDLLGDEKGYVQFGSLKGQISRENMPDTELNLACVRKRYWGSLECETLNKYLTVFAATENGHLMHFGIKSVRNGCKELKFGHVLTNAGSVFPIRDTDLDQNKIEQSISDKITIHVEAKGKIFKLIFTMNRNDSVELVNNNFHGSKCRVISGECIVNLNRGMAILNYWNSHKGNGIRRPTPILKELRVEDIPSISVTTLGSEESKILELTGGKGNSLALMKCLNNDEITIPDGFIVTTFAFQQQIENNFHLKKALCLLEDIALGRERGNLENACQVTEQLFKEQTIMPSVAQSVLDELMKFRRKHDEKIVPYLRWAVRSSAIGEDSEEFSSAGQNETFLGCQTDKDVLLKITKCWASLFTYQSVMYRRQHGLPIQTSMAVVVQKMIPAESAGVLFTCHPSNANPAKMIITSNFGLGETVVSGESEPDTIELSKTFDGTVTFHSYTLGSKGCSMLMSRYGVHKNTSNCEISAKLSLSKKDAEKLGRIGVSLEEAFGGPRDIEWAIFKGHLYILQSRPVTTLNQWTDYELLHELDTPHVSNDTFYTRANIGEVLPFALTALTQTTVVEGTEKGFQIRMFGKYDPYVDRTIVFSHHYGMIELIGGIYARPRKQIEIASKMVDLAIFGYPVLNEELNKKAIARYGLFSDYDKMKELAHLFKVLWQASDILKKMMRTSEEINIDIGKKDTAIEIYEKIKKFMEAFADIAHTHCLVSSVSIMYQTFAMITLMEGKEDITLEHHGDLGLILSSCEDVVSAEVPTRLEEIAEVIKNSGLAEEFSTVPSEMGAKWLRENSAEANKLLEEFLTDHGHRLLGELELSLNSWGMDPSVVIRMIQMNLKLSTGSKKRVNSQKDVVEELSSPKKFLTKKILRFLINKQRIAVGNREKAKSAMVKVVHKSRIAYRILAKTMVHEGFIPSESLIYHLTQYELSQILHRKNTNLVSKAMRRQRLYPIWNKLKFPDIMYGIPVPEAEDVSHFETMDCNAVCTGTPVCVGEVTARACVITSLDEIKQLKEGDILITKSTDIGWSPYFPILSGIATELGGLVSHGAVVAREYGLPCIIGAKNATKIFKTGDKVYFSGKTGTINLIPK